MSSPYCFILGGVGLLSSKSSSSSIMAFKFENSPPESDETFLEGIDSTFSSINGPSSSFSYEFSRLDKSCKIIDGLIVLCDYTTLSTRPISQELLVSVKSIIGLGLCSSFPIDKISNMSWSMDSSSITSLKAPVGGWIT